MLHYVLSRFSAPTVLSFVVLLFGRDALAQETTIASTEPTVDINIFQPTPGARNFFTTESGHVNSHLGISGGLNLNYAYQPLSVVFIEEDEQNDIGAVVPWRLDAVALAALGLYDIAEIGLAVPFVNQGNLDASGFEAANLANRFPDEISSFAVGDIRVVPKINLLELDDGIFSAAAVGTVILPTGDADYARENNLVLAPSLALSSTLGPVRLGLNVGYRIRDRTRTATLIVDDEYFAKGAAAYDISGNGTLEVIGEVYGQTPQANPFAQNSQGISREIQKARTSAEGIAGIRWLLPNQIIISAGAGGGLIGGYGAGAPRLFAQLTYYSGAFGAVDSDQDGVSDTFDDCPGDQEDIDEFEDSDGCPDEDNDQDAILDEDDGCPMDPEDIDGFRDNDGCPEPDNDDDGILDNDDQCVVDAEDIDNFQDDDGCPDLDNDEDTVPDSTDQCANEKEDKDGYLDYDGCPEEDNDGDGLNDLNDLCPNHAEDKDGIADDDGCPDDNDNDGIADENDQCPNKAETYNGIDDQDGCPERRRGRSLVNVTDEKIEIQETIYFRAGSARILRRSNNVLNQVASLLTSYKHITELEIQGHTDSTGNKRRNQRISEQRAESVKQYLIDQGVEAERLVAKGYGSTQPITSNRSRAGRNQNRRVEFVIQEQKPVGVDVSDNQPPPPSAPSSADGIEIEFDEIEPLEEGSDSDEAEDTAEEGGYEDEQ